MADTSITDWMIGIAIFLFIAIGSSLVITHGFNQYGITDTNELSEFNNSEINKDLTTLGADLENKDYDSKVSNSNTASWVDWGVVGGVITKTKAIRNLVLTSTNITRKILDFVPPLLWWIFGFITSIMMVMLIINAYLRWRA